MVSINLRQKVIIKEELINLKSEAYCLTKRMKKVILNIAKLEGRYEQI